MPSPTRTLLNPQVPPECVTVPAPLAATPRSLPLRLLKVAVRSPRGLKPLPETPSAKLTLPGRSGRSCAGLSAVTRPLTDQVSRGDHRTRPLTLACPPNRSISAGSKLKLSLSRVPVTSSGIAGKARGAGAAAHVHLVRQDAAERERAGSAAHGDVVPDERPAEIAPARRSDRAAGRGRRSRSCPCRSRAPRRPRAAAPSAGP